MTNGKKIFAQWEQNQLLPNFESYFFKRKTLFKGFNENYAQWEKNICPTGIKNMPSGKKMYVQQEKNICPVRKKYMPSGKKIYAQQEKIYAQ